MKNANIRKHFDDAVYEHTRMLLNHSNDLYTLWSDTKQELEDTNTNLAKTTAVLMETLRKLAETRKELIATQDDLEESKSNFSGKVQPTIINNNTNNDEMFADEMNMFRKEIDNMKKKQAEEAALRREEEKKRTNLERELKKMQEEREIAEAKARTAEETKKKALAEAKARAEADAKERAEVEAKVKAANDARAKALAEAEEAKETAAAKEKELIRLKEAQTVAAAVKTTEVIKVVEVVKDDDFKLKKTPEHKRSREELREATSHIVYPKKALPPEPVDKKEEEVELSDSEADTPVYSKVIKFKKNVTITEPQPETVEPLQDVKTDTLVKKAKKVSIVEPVRDEKPKDEDKDERKKSIPEEKLETTKPEVAKVTPITKESAPKEPIDKNGKEPAIVANNSPKDEPQQLQPMVKSQPQQVAVTQMPVVVKPNKRPNSPLQALVDGLNTDSSVIYCDTYYALMIKLETDRFYRINGDMYVKINTRGLLRPYDVIYLQPWEERDRLAFQDLQYNRRIMHYTDRVAIEVGSKTAIVKLLAGCTTSSATATILHTQQCTSFLPAFIDKYGWGYNVPIGLQRSTFYSQDHMLVRIRRRSMSREDMLNGF